MFHKGNTTERVFTKELQKKSFLQWVQSYDNNRKEKELESARFKENASLLIDQFISNQPKINPKREFYSPIDMGKKSLQENDDLASETLAKIYFQQGNINKAIGTYQILSLKFPEKKAYFASEIEKIKTSQNK